MAGKGLPCVLCSAPESTTLPYKSFLMSTSHFMIELKAVSSMPAASMPTMLGVNSTSGQRKRSLPIVITYRGRAAYEQQRVAQLPWQLSGEQCILQAGEHQACRSQLY